MTKYKYIILASFAILFAGSACEKVIDIELNEADQTIVIEAIVEDQIGSNQVQITRSGGFYQTNDFEAVNGAEVIITDENGNSFSLEEKEPGIYQHDSLTGDYSQTYTLTVSTDGKDYAAASTVPSEVKIDSVSYEFVQTPFGTSGYRVLINFTDPAETLDYYRVKIYKQGEKGGEYQIFNDELFNGNPTQLGLFQTLFEKGDEVIVELIHIDEAAYDYFNALLDITSDAGPGLAAPANPKSNITNNALGYFSAQAVAREVFVVE